jgi:hypothetical protein
MHLPRATFTLRGMMLLCVTIAVACSMCRGIVAEVRSRTGLTERLSPNTGVSTIIFVGFGINCAGIGLAVKSRNSAGRSDSDARAISSPAFA